MDRHLASPPPPDGIVIDNIPPELKVRPQWVSWRGEMRNGRLTKIPYDPKPDAMGRRASSTDPETWGTFEQALAMQSTDGIGYVFSPEDPYAGVDLDKCINDDGSLQGWARRGLDLLDSYAEYSPSFKGIHAIVHGKVPSGGNRSGQVEMYDQGRYFTFTGRTLAQYPATIEKRQVELEEFHKDVIGKPKPGSQPVTPRPVDLPDGELFERMFGSKNGKKIESLFRGDHSEYPSQSEADLALVNYLYFWSGGDESRVDAWFRRSGLMRGKWDEVHGDMTYGEGTIQKAARDARDVYEPDRVKEKTRPGPEVDSSMHVRVTFLDTVEREEVTFLWDPYIPNGKITFLAGDPGAGKTFLAIKICSMVTSGRGFDGLPKEPGLALYFSLEDGLGDTLLPRAEVMGADLSKFGVIRHMEAVDPDTKELVKRLPTLQNTVQIEAVIAKYRPQIVVFDPVQSFMGAGVDFHRANEVRPVLEAIGDIAQEYGCAVLFVAHMNKGGGNTGSAIYRLLGSIDLAGVARSIMMAGRMELEDGEEGRALAHAKSNLAREGPTVTYEIHEDGVVSFGGSVEGVFAGDVLNGGKRESGGHGNAVAEAKELILELLVGPMPASRLRKQLGEVGVSGRTLERARAELKKEQLIDMKRKGFGAGGEFWWYRMDLPEPDWAEIWGAQ